jgi:hypothetical protein
MGWKETSVNEQVGKDGGPIETKDVSAIDVIRARIADASARLDGLKAQVAQMAANTTYVIKPNHDLYRSDTWRLYRPRGQGRRPGPC